MQPCLTLVSRTVSIAAFSLLTLLPAIAAPPASVPYQWQSVAIVAGGFVSGIEFSPADPHLIYCRTDIGGPYRWDYLKKQWIPLTDWVGEANGNLRGVESLAPDPQNPNRVYAALGTYMNAGNGVIARSDNQGRTWKLTQMPFPMGGNENGRSIGERLVVDPNNTHILYFGSRSDGLWKSTDRAVTWHKVSSFPAEGIHTPLNQHGPNDGIGWEVFDLSTGTPGKASATIYVGVEDTGFNLYRSTDAGKTWSTVSGQPKGLLPQHGVLSASGILYITYGSAEGPNGVTSGAVWRYNTHNGHWKNITPVFQSGAAQSGFAGLSVDARTPAIVMVSTLDHWSGGDQIFRSTDEGGHWKAVFPLSSFNPSLSPYLKWGAAQPRPGWWIGTLEIDPFFPGHVLYGTGATIWETNDIANADTGGAVQWQVGARGIEETAVLDLISPPEGAHLLSALGDIGGFRHNDLQRSPRAGMFMHPLFNTTTSLDFAAMASQIIVRSGNGAPGQCGAVSDNGGTTWSPFPSNPAGTRGGGKIALSAHGHWIVWAAQGAAPACSNNNGKTWTPCSGIPAFAVPVSDRSTAATFYCASGGRLFVSRDGGRHFIPERIALPVERGKLFAAPDAAGSLWFASEKSGLYHIFNEKIVHINSIQSCSNLGFGKAAPGQNVPAIYFTGTVEGVEGVFRSTDNGKTVVRINDDMHQYGWIGEAVTGDPRIFGRVYLGTNGRGILYADPVPAKR